VRGLLEAVGEQAEDLDVAAGLGELVDVADAAERAWGERDGAQRGEQAGADGGRVDAVEVLEHDG
jgi:hypothetical protein